MKDYIKQLEEANEKLTQELESTREELDCIKKISHRLCKCMKGSTNEKINMPVYGSQKVYNHIVCKFSYERDNEEDYGEVGGYLTDLFYCWEENYDFKTRSIIESD